MKGPGRKFDQLAVRRLFVALATLAGCQRHPAPPLELSLSLPHEPFTPGTGVYVEFNLRNASSHQFWIDFLPTFDARPGQGDFILRIQGEGGTVVPFGCAVDDGIHRHYIHARPGETRHFPSDFYCFDFQGVPPGIYTIEARYQPRNNGCAPPPGVECFRGETNTATARVRFEAGRLFPL